MPFGRFLAPASELYVFPGKGQSEARMEQDKFSCYQWARKNTGYVPANPPRVSTTTTGSQPYPGGDIVRGAAKDTNVPWSATVDKESGRLVATQPRKDTSFTVSGACMPK